MTGQLLGTPHDGDWRQRTAAVVETMREMSRQTDPQEMVRAYARRMRQLLPLDGSLSLSRRGLQAPRVRITRSSRWQGEVNPWKQKDLLPVLAGGLLAELIYGEEPRVIDDLRVPATDPAAEYLAGYRTLVAVPHYHEGHSLNMVIHLRQPPGAFDTEALPELVLTSNLFGRATQSLVLSDQLKHAYDSLDRELKAVAEIQHSLLPPRLPDVPGLELACHYQTSQRAGGDYYDLFPLPGGAWGIFIADVSGHGTPAAVVMAITHSIAHAYPGPPAPPGRMLAYLNRTLAERYTGNTGTFVTAFYGIYSPADRSLTYACAGHNPPRLLRKGAASPLDGAPAGLPLGILPDETYRDARRPLAAGDLLLFYTDGITEAFSPAGDLFGLERLDAALCHDPRGGCGAAGAVAGVLAAVAAFADGRPANDDRTLLAVKVL